MSKIRGILFILYFGISVAIIITLMYIFKSKNREIRRNWAKLTLLLFGIKIEIDGERDLEAKILFINHQSMLDIIILEALERDNLCWIAKKEIGKVPLYGHILKAPKMIEVDREDKRGLIKLIKDVKNRLNSNRTISMFPEGTRSKGDKILKFRNGGKFIADKLDLKVQPILIIGANYALDTKTLTQNSHTIKVLYLKTANRSSENWYQDIQKDMNLKLKEYLK